MEKIANYTPKVSPGIPWLYSSLAQTNPIKTAILTLLPGISFGAAGREIRNRLVLSVEV